MNFAPTFSVWAHLFAALAAETVLVVLIAALLQRVTRSAAWR